MKQALPVSKKLKNFYTAASILQTVLNTGKMNPLELQRLLIQCYEKTYSLSPNARDLYFLCRISREIGDESSARKYLKQLSEAFPGSRLTQKAKKLMDRE